MMEEARVPGEGGEVKGEKALEDGGYVKGEGWTRQEGRTARKRTGIRKGKRGKK